VQAGQEDVLAWNASKQSEVDVMSGHFGYGVHLQRKYLVPPKRRVAYLAFLRHPVERALSQWRREAGSESLAKLDASARRRRFMRWWEVHMGYKRAELAGTLSAKVSVSVAPPWRAASNPMTRQMCCWSPALRATQPPDPPCPQTKATLECAKERLASFAAVGLVERMEESVALAKCALGVKYEDQDDRSHIPWDNPTLSASAEQHLSLWEATSEQIRLISDANPLDLELYMYAVELFEKQIQTARLCMKLHRPRSGKEDDTWWYSGLG